MQAALCQLEPACQQTLAAEAGTLYLDACFHGPVAALQARQHGRPLRLRACADLIAMPMRPSSEPTRRAGPLLLFLILLIVPLETRGRSRCHRWQRSQLAGCRSADVANASCKHALQPASSADGPRIATGPQGTKSSGMT